MSNKMKELYTLKRPVAVHLPFTNLMAKGLIGDCVKLNAEGMHRFTVTDIGVMDGGSIKFGWMRQDEAPLSIEMNYNNVESAQLIED